MALCIVGSGRQSGTSCTVSSIPNLSHKLFVTPAADCRQDLTIPTNLSQLLLAMPVRVANGILPVGCSSSTSHFAPVCSKTSIQANWYSIEMQNQVGDTGVTLIVLACTIDM